jgi:hypothetical protein
MITPCAHRVKGNKIQSLALNCLALSASLLATPSWAVRTAVFSDTQRYQAAIWQDQDRVFNAESTTELKARPIWIHTGDSIATGWANGATLFEQIRKAQNSELPQPGSVQDLFEHVPQYTKTWYAGTELQDKSLLNQLQKFSNKSWVIISTALAGSLFNDVAMNTLSVAPTVKNLDRVQLVTISLGGNDICQMKEITNGSSAPDEAAAPDVLLSNIQTAIPKNAKVIAMLPPPVTELYSSIQLAINNLPPELSLAKARIKAYCTAVWEDNNCPGAKVENASKASKIRQQIIDLYRARNITTIDVYANLRNVNILELMAADCFHPGPYAEKAIADAYFSEWIKANPTSEQPSQ